jgi:hypothetical protein
VKGQHIGDRVALIEGFDRHYGFEDL